MKSSFPYCGAHVRDHDPDRFLLSMFAPAERRESLWALFAFNYEIAKTREVVSETQLGLVRLQWWREAVGKIYDGSDMPDHEILKALAHAVKAFGLPLEMFNTLVYAREFDLENVCPATLDGLLNYADFTSVPLMNLALMICGDDPDMEPVPAVAVNYALAGLLRSVPRHAAQRRCYLPEDLMKKHGVTLKQLFDMGRPEPTLPGLVREVAGQFVPGIHPSSKLLAATQVLAGIYMGQLRRNGYDPYAPKMAVSPALKALRLALWTKAA
jgi:phytoene synthase